LLTVDFTKFPINPGDRVLDLGCGAGRHAFEAYRRGARVVAADLDAKELPPVGAMFAAMREAGETSPPAGAAAASADATRLPFADGAFDAIIAAEILEHVPDDTAALAEIARVLRPGGTLAVTVPAWLPERICWALSSEYHEVPGGHVRIFTRAELGAKLAAAGLTPTGGHHAHGLHSAYWWLKCAVGVHDDAHPAVRAYHRLLVWDIMSKPALTRLSEAALNPLIGKSLIIYARKAQPAKPGTPNGFAVPVTRAHSPHRAAGGPGGVVPTGRQSAGGCGGGVPPGRQSARGPGVVVPPGEQSDLAGSGAAE
jgi:SAM-dependent methyltransferase